MLLDALFSDGDLMWNIAAIAIALPLLLFSLTVHEYAHGFAAYKQGDGFAKYSGRLSLNPLKHLDPLGTISMLLFGFGWAKPVPVVPSNFKNGKTSMLIVASAGVFANLILAFISLFLAYFMSYVVLVRVGVTTLSYLIIQVFNYLVMCNITLAVFNLLPIPPLDGYKIFKELTIGKINYRLFANMEAYSTYILLAFLLLGDRIGLISTITSFVYDLMCKAMDLIFVAFI